MPWITPIGVRGYSGPLIWVPDRVTITPYKPPAKPVSVIGIVAGSATLTHIAYDNATGLSAQLTQTVFDTTTRADSAQILLTNATGSAKVLRGVIIRAKQITKLSGDGGYLNDKHVDYESIALNGEIKAEIGNDFIVTFDQTNQLADYYWKNNRIRRHLYALSMTGCQSFFEPGEWYTLAIGSVGHDEYINSTVTCYSVRCSKDAGGIGSTQITFLEMYQNWVFDSNETARSIASGIFNRTPATQVVTVASSTSMSTADFYCDGTADQTEINAAIKYVVALGGGTVQLSEGTFNLSGVIDLSFSNLRLTGMGNGTKLSGSGINAYGALGSNITNVIVSNLAMIGIGVLFRYTDNPLVNGCTFMSPDQTGIYFFECNDARAIDNMVDGELSAVPSTFYGIWVQNVNRCTIANNTVKRIRITNSASSGIYFNTVTGGVISSNSIFDSSVASDNNCYGIYLTNSSYIIVSGNRVEQIKNSSTTSMAYGIYINSGTSNSVTNCYIYNCGTDTGITNTNGCLFYDGGTGTQIV
jgi:parallel beta-helix repeat protein